MRHLTRQVSSVAHAFGFALAALNAPRRGQRDLHFQPQRMLHRVGQALAQSFQRTDLVAEKLRGHFHLYFHRVQAFVARQQDLIMRHGAFYRQQRAFDLRGEDVHAADDEHVVAAARDAADAAHRAPARAGLGGQHADVARTVADHRHGLLAERGQHQFALFSVRHDASRLGIDHLRVEVVLENVQAVVIGAFDAHARPDDFRQAVDVESLNPALRFDVTPHRFGPRFGAEDADAQRQIAHVDTELTGALDQVNEVTRRAADGGDPEILQYHNLAVGVAPGDRDHGGAQRFGAVVRAQSAGEQTVAVGVLHHVAVIQAAGRKRPHHHGGPDVQVLLRVGHHNRFAGGAAGSVYADHVPHGAGKEAEGIGVAQVGLGGEGQVPYVGESVEPVGREVALVEPLAEELDAVVGAPHHGPQPL